MLTYNTLLVLICTASAEVLWDGRANDYATSAFLDKWSWSNQVGPYQWYIHGNGSTSDYVDMSTQYKNPADTASEQGFQLTIDDTSSWNGQTMMRTELIPQTSAAINSGEVFYHFSVQHTATNPPIKTAEHQVCFFESHFTELKYGSSGGSSNQLQWYANSEAHWNATFEPGIWHNIAYGIDFDAQTVTFYHSTGAEDLVLTAGPVSATTPSNGADWHLGVLRLPGSTGQSATEDWHFSGVYIESGGLTTSVSGPVNLSNSSASIMALSSVSSALSQEAATQTSCSTMAPTTLHTTVRSSSFGTAVGSGVVPSLVNGTTTKSVLHASGGATTVNSTATSTIEGTATNAASTFSATAEISPSEWALTSLSSSGFQTTSVATNAARTFSATESIDITHNPTSGPTWYPEPATPSGAGPDCKT